MNTGIVPSHAGGSVLMGALLCAQLAICGFGHAAEPPPTDAIPLVLPWGHSLPVSCIAFSNDGKRIATGSADHTAIVWDAITGRELGTLGDLSQDAITSIAISADGRDVATGSTQGEVVVWDTDTRKKRRTLVWHQDKITSLAFHDNGNVLWSASADKSAVIWDVASGLKRQVLNTVSPIVSAAINPDCSLAVTDETDGTVVLWDLASGKRVHMLPGKPAPKPVAPARPDADPQPADDARPWAPVEGVAFSPDGKQFAAALPDKSIVVCIGNTGETLHTLVGHDAPVVCLAFSSDGGELVSAACIAAPAYDYRNMARVWDTHTGAQARTLDFFNNDPVGITADASRLVVVPYGYFPGERQGVKLIDTSSGKTVRELKSQFGKTPIAISLDGKQMVLDDRGEFGAERTPVVIQFFQAEPKFLRLSTRFASEKSMRFSSDGTRFGVTTQYGDECSVWDLKTVSSKENRVADAKSDPFFTLGDVEFSPDLKQISSHPFKPADAKNMLRLTEIETGKALWTLPIEGRERCTVAFSPNGKQLAVGTLDVVIYDAATGATIKRLGRTTESNAHASTVVFSPDGKLLASATRDGLVTLWDVRTGGRLHVFLEGHAGDHPALAFSPDGAKLATTDDGGRPMLLDTTTGLKIPTTLRGTSAFIRKFWFSPDGKLVAAVDDSAIVYWDVATGEKRLTLMFLDAEKDWFAVTPDGLFDGSERGRQIVGARTGDGMNVVPAQQLAKRYYRPGLLNAILAGERPRAQKEGK